jgi:UDP-2-acetamido-3-amino-2,3-dideoxy-glucuronate N-acetyltransferase
MESSIARIAVVGSGYWGRNLVRNFHQLGALQVVCDAREEPMQEARAQYGVRTISDVDSVLNDEEIEGVVIAAPAAQHFQLATKCLLRDKDVYVEKPLALCAEEGRQLVQLASERHRILMVGHILEYHPAILELRRLIRSGELGRLQYIYSSRLNLGKLRTEENILWSFAPHDISAILFLLEENPVRVSAHGGSYVDPRTVDTTLTTCQFASGVQAHIFVSWLHPFKEQKLAVVGSKKMAVFDDMQREHKLVLYPHRIDWLDRTPIAHKADAEAVELPSSCEPLRLECEHFLHCMRTREVPRTSGASALRVLQVIEACERSLRSDGASVPIAGAAPSYFAHPSAVIDTGAQIGEGTRIWHFSHIMADSTIGRDCNLGQNVVVSPLVKIGNHVKIQNNVSLYTGVELEDDVFCGPSMVFTNVVNPRSHVVRKSDYRQTLVRHGASIGANATVVCGVTLGKYCFVGAGAVVTRDVPDYALMVGVPATQIGWMCNCGIRLDNASGEGQCAACGRKYRITDGRCSEISGPVAVPSRAPSEEDKLVA